MAKSPPQGDHLSFNFSGDPYTPPSATHLKFNLIFVNYTPPRGNRLAFNFSGDAYTPPRGDQLSFNYKPDDDTPVIADQYLFPASFDVLEFGNHQIAGQRWIYPNSQNISVFGLPKVYNLNQCVVSYGFDAFVFGYAEIINTSATIVPIGFDAGEIGLTTSVVNYTRYIVAGLGGSADVSSQHTIWNWRKDIQVSGFAVDDYGVARVEHARRVIFIQGNDQVTYGNSAWISYATRLLSPASIEYPEIPTHNIGGTQHLQPIGYIATEFGKRIIPENQAVYLQGFSELFGETTIDLLTKYINPLGFISTEQEGGYRFGTQQVWNLSQYITQVYDSDSGLAPPQWVGWTSIENCNRTITTIGHLFSKVAEPIIENTARVITISGFATLAIDQLMIADRIRHIQPQGLEAPYIGGWGVVYNTAFVMESSSWDSQKLGVVEIANTRRYFNGIGNFDSLEMGLSMIADRIRNIKIESRYTIEPPHIPVPCIDLYTRYIDEVGRFDDYQAFGNSSLSIHWNIVTTRWTHRDFLGEPTVKKLTPELLIYGHNSEEFGQAIVRLEWRPLDHKGDETLAFGQIGVAFRDRQFLVSGFTQSNLPSPKVTKTGIPPYYPQYIWLDEVETDGIKNSGYGIDVGAGQVAEPIFNRNVLYPLGFSSAKVSEDLSLQSNSIIVDYGIYEKTIGTPTITLQNRGILLDGYGIDATITVGQSRLSPYTIYAVMEAPEQAKQNHSSVNALHYVNSDLNSRTPGEVFGTAILSSQNRNLSINGSQFLEVGQVSIELKRRYIEPKGLLAFRFGSHQVGDGIQAIGFYSSTDFLNIGTPTITLTPESEQMVLLQGLDVLVCGIQVISLLHRTIDVIGFGSMQMGQSGNEPYNGYTWQTLHVGELKPVQANGFDVSLHGATWISNRIRNVVIAGFESFAMEYDYTAFLNRIRVSREVVRQPQQVISPVGVAALYVGTPNIRNKVHYIYPMGNSDQFRKGAW